MNKEKSKNEGKKKRKRTFSDNMRQLKYNLTAIRANLKFVFRIVLRELKYFLPLQDLIVLFLMIGVVLFFILIVVIWGIPFSLSFIDPEEAYRIHTELIRPGGLIFNATVLRWGAGIIGVGTVVIRLMVKSPINKYKDKINTKKDVTYIFGSSRPAEQFLFEMVSQYGYEEKVSLISDANLLWVRKLRANIDIYVVDDLREFEKPNLYEIIGFENASRIMILTESVELNQNILTRVRQVRPDVDIILLSQYAPSFVFSDLVKDKNLIIIEDLDATIQGLVTSLSLDFDFPKTAEIDVPRPYIGHTGSDMSFDIPKIDILLIRRGKELLNPQETLEKGDRVILHYFSNYNLMLANRVVTELPFRTKNKKIESKKSKKSKKQMTHEMTTSSFDTLFAKNESISESVENVLKDSEETEVD